MADPKFGLSPCRRAGWLVQKKLRLDLREPHVVSPAVSIDLEMMRAVVIPAIDQHIVHAHLAHLAEGDLLPGVGHGAAVVLADNFPGSEHELIEFEKLHRKL